ncbi:ead/Ea22-like family protein [Klebsiella pneumoniae]|uniref:ead/Ea22-like family protein n=1 Tax=Klebsiella pneumoniae TaxID=573 RepID=UPI000E2B007E|nr:ead/Ea22-like family protein [Klebsiella pneumoniae]SVX40677.1 Ead domain protein [Klebsiella pneumoniae]
MTDITELAQSLKAAANKAGADDWQAKKISGDFYVIRKGSYSSQCGYRTYQPIAEIDHKSTRDYVAIASPANVLALVEALEKAQAAERRWHRVASRIHEQACESDVKIDELEAIRAAAEKLVRCKGRYHSEQNYRALAALFGVNTPDLPPLEHENVHYADAAEMEIVALRQRIAEVESRTVTVKLTDINEYLAEVHDKTLNQALRLLAEGVRAGDVAAMRAAGIKVEAE